MIGAEFPAAMQESSPDSRLSAATISTRLHLLKAESFICGESMLAVLVDEPPLAVCARLEQVASDGGHEVVWRPRVAAPAKDAGRPLAPGKFVRVYDADRPGVMALVLGADPAMAHVIPWRIVVHDAHGVTTVATPRPSVTWPELLLKREIA